MNITKIPCKEDEKFANMLASQLAEQHRQRAASIVAEFKLLPAQDQTDVLAHLNQLCLRGAGVLFDGVIELPVQNEVING